jgi:hypothetical protein
VAWTEEIATARFHKLSWMSERMAMRILYS